MHVLCIYVNRCVNMFLDVYMNNFNRYFLEANSHKDSTGEMVFCDILIFCIVLTFFSFCLCVDHFP